MLNLSKKASLWMLAAVAIVCSRSFFFFIDDPEGPNLLIVGVLALLLFGLSYSAYLLKRPAHIYQKFLLAVLIQILAVMILLFFLE